MRLRDLTQVQRQEFDFIIVGAGSAGCVLAERLSAAGRNTVCLIEAGGTDRRFWVQVPLGYGKTFFDKRINWAYLAEPDPGLGGQRDYWPRGKLLGGSSSINAMVWIRGDARDFDDWAAEGNPGWAFADCLPVFKAIEDNEAGADRWRGVGGDVRVSDVSERLHPLVQRYIQAGLQAGLRFNPDFNGETQEGIGFYQTTTHGGWRVSASTAFLRKAMARRNLEVLTRAHACRILFDGKRARAVEVATAGRREVISARGEIIVAAGAVNSPQLLQLSGIGPAQHLTAHGIAVVHHSPAVGHHLADHLGINFTYRSRVRTLNNVLAPWWGRVGAGIDFLARGQGPLSLSLNQGGGFLRTRPGLDRANIQLYFQAISTLGAKAGARPLTSPDPFPGFSIGLSTCKPTSRGSILVASPDPFAHPRIMPNALSTPVDVQDVLEGLKFLRIMAAQPALCEVIDAELAPGPAVASDDELITDFRARSGTVYHPCGTCRMGPDPLHAVVDRELRVHGVEGLRVVDASIFPSIVSGNTNAPVMMVAAKIAPRILAAGR